MLNLNKRLIDQIVVQDRPWSWRLFSLLTCIYLSVILLLALPDGVSTELTAYGMPNPECTNSRVDSEESANCNPILRITANSTAEEYLKFFGGSDPGSYVRGGLMLVGQEGDLPKDYTDRLFKLQVVERLKLMNLLGFGTFPPGMYFLNALPLKLNAEAPLGLYQAIVASTLWAIAFALTVSLLAMRVRKRFAVALPFLCMLLPIFHQYFFRYGVVYSETYTASIIVIGLTLLIHGFYQKTNSSLMLISGACFAAASLLRAQAFHVAIGVTIVLVGYYAVINFKRYLTTGNANSKSATSLNLIAICAFLAGFCIPTGTYYHFNDNKLLNIGFLYKYPFTTPPYPDAGMKNFIALGGIRTACDVDLMKCEENRQRIDGKEMTDEEARTEVFRAFIHHPLNFSINKLPIAWKYWMASSGVSPGPVLEISYSIEGVILLLLFMLCLWLTIVRRLWWLLCISISMCGLIFVPPFLLEFEVRYFFLMKAFVMFWPLWLLMISSNKLAPNFLIKQSERVV